MPTTQRTETMRTRNEFGTCYACPRDGRKRMNPDGKTYAFACSTHVVVRDVPHPKGNRKARRKGMSKSAGPHGRYNGGAP